MTRDLRVQAKADYIASLSHASPLAAIEELVWNALDADAREVRIDLVQNGLGGIDAVRISDDGTGIALDGVERTFGGLGGSWKREDGAVSAGKRHLHGRHGRGRFKAFALGCHVAWNTTFDAGKGLKSYAVSGDLEEPGVFHLDETATGPATGTEVLITNVRANANALADAGWVVSTLAAKFALYLKSYPNVRIYFGGLPVTPVIVQKACTAYTLRLETGAEAKFEVIEWRRRFPGSGRLVFCGADGFSLYDLPAGVRPGAPFCFTAYLVGARFDALAAENALIMDELNPETRAYLDAARKTLRDHFKVRAAEEDAQRLQQWIDEGSYPFARDDAGPARAAFDARVADMRANLEGFDALPASERKYLFNVLLKIEG